MQEIRDKYTAFAAMLAQRLHQDGKILSVSLCIPQTVIEVMIMLP